MGNIRDTGRKLILFDWGNVLLNSDFASDSDGYTAKQASIESFKQVNVSEEAWNTLLYSDGLWTLQGDHLNAYLSDYMSAESIPDFKAAWHQNMKKVPWFEENLQLMDGLKRHYPNAADMGILSVCSELDSPLIMERTSFATKFNFFSYSMGLRKPDHRIYKNIQTMLKIQCDQILYFDDWKPSVDAAKSYGWNAVCLDGRDHALIKKHVEEFIDVNLNESKMWGDLLIEDTIRSL